MKHSSKEFTHYIEYYLDDIIKLYGFVLPHFITPAIQKFG